MFPSHSAEQQAIASQLLAELDAYERSMEQMLRNVACADAYREQCERFDRMEMVAAALPRLAPAWSELLISRVELAQALWCPSLPTRITARVRALDARHKKLVDEVRGRCREYLADIAL